MGKSAQELINDANKLISKKKYKKALAIYLKLCEARPKDFKSWIKVGDLLRQLGEDKQALAAYVRAANGLASDGQLMQAIAVNKIVLEIEPGHTAIQKRLAKLYAAKEKSKSQTPDDLNAELAKSEVKKDKVDDSQILEVEHSAGDDDEPAITTHRLDDITEQAESDEDVAIRLSDMPDTPLFSELIPEHFAAIIPKIQLRRVEAGETVVQEGGHGDSLFIIATGEAKVTKSDADGSEIYLGSMDEGSFFGEIALFEAGKRSATVTASSELSLLEIRKSDLDELAREFPSITATMQQFYQQRLLRTILRFSAPFKEIPEFHLLSIIRRFQHAEMDTGTKMLEEGEVPSGLMVIESGTVIGYGGELERPMNLSRGDYIALPEFLESEPSRFSYETATPARLFNLPDNFFGTLIKRYPNVKAELAKL